MSVGRGCGLLAASLLAASLAVKRISAARAGRASSRSSSSRWSSRSTVRSRGHRDEVATSSVGAHTRGRVAIAGAVGLGILLAANVGREVHPDIELGDVALPFLLLGGPGWQASRSFAARAGSRWKPLGSRRRTPRWPTSERRIARELHDAVAHSIGVVVLQARGARKTMQSDPRLPRGPRRHRGDRDPGSLPRCGAWSACCGRR